MSLIRQSVFCISLMFAIMSSVFASAIRDENIEIVHTAIQMAMAEGREIHILVGAVPTEAHMAEVIMQDPMPLRIFICNYNAEEKSEAELSNFETPVITMDWRNEEVWQTYFRPIYEAYGGFLDKFYFDISVFKSRTWKADEWAENLKYFKPGGEVYFPNSILEYKSADEFNQIAVAFGIALV